MAQNPKVTETQGEVAALELVAEKLAPSDKRFALDLIASFHKRGSLSEKQCVWVRKLTERAAPQVNAAPKAPAQVAQVGDFSGVYALMGTAAQHLKHPKIRLQTPAGKPVALSVAGPKARAPGTINVTDGGPYGENRYFGRIDKSGAWEIRSDTPSDVIAIVARLAKSPVEVASEYGRLTGNCCFCRKTLTDERSTAVGYGPVCAGHYELPWGEAHTDFSAPECVDEGVGA